MKRFLLIISALLIFASVCFGFGTNVTDEANVWDELQTFLGGVIIGPSNEDAYLEFPIANQPIGSDGHVVATYNANHTAWVWYVRISGELVPIPSQTWNFPEVFTVSFSDGVTLSDSFSATIGGVYSASFSDGVTLSDSMSSTVTGSCSTFTSDTCTGGTASASTVYSGHPASWAFDNNTTQSWWSNFEDPATVQYDYGVGVTKIIVRARIYPSNENGGDWCDNVIIKGSNDGSNWDTLLTSGQLSYANYNDLDFNNSTGYRYYSITGTDNNNNMVAIREIELLECND